MGAVVHDSGVLHCGSDYSHPFGVHCLVHLCQPTRVLH